MEIFRGEHTLAYKRYQPQPLKASTDIILFSKYKRYICFTVKLYNHVGTNTNRSSKYYMKNDYLGVILIVGGIIYIVKPNIFRVGIWKKTSIPQQTFTPRNYNIFMRILGVIVIILGIYKIFIK